MKLEEGRAFLDTEDCLDVSSRVGNLQEVGPVQVVRSMTRERLSDDEWKEMLAVLSESIGIKERNGYTRNLIEATLWMAQEQVRWTDLPKQYGLQHLAYLGFTRWARNGKWRAVLGCLDDLEDMNEVKVNLERMVWGYLKRNQRGEFQR